MHIPLQIFKTHIEKITYNGEPVELNKFIDESGEYYEESFNSTLSCRGIEQIGKLIKSCEIYIEGHGWFFCTFK